MKRKVTTIGLMLILAFCSGNLLANDLKSVEDIKNALKPEKKAPLIRARGVMGAAPAQPTSQEPSFTMQLQFEKNRYDLTNPSMAQLRNLGKALEDDELRKYVYKIEGHTCNLGKDAHNLRLSRKRASAVAAYLEQNFHLPKEQFVVKGHGETRPVVSNDTEAGRQKNRRVVIVNTLETFGTPGDITSSPQVRVEVKRIRDGEVKTLAQGERLVQTDNYAVEFDLKTTAHLYVFQVDSNGKTTRLFPDPNFSEQTNPLEPGKPYRIPDKGNWFYLDDDKGEEQIVVLAHEGPITSPEKICSLALKSDEKTRAASPIRARGIGGMVDEVLGMPALPATSDNDWNWDKTFKWILHFTHQ